MKPIGRRLGRRFLVALVAVLLFGGWQGGFAALLRARPRAAITAKVENLQFSPDSQLVVTWGRHSGPLQVWDASGHELLSKPWDGVNTAQFSSAGNLLAVHKEGGELTVWETCHRNGSFSHTLTATFSDCVRFAFSPCGRYLAVQEWMGPVTPPAPDELVLPRVGPVRVMDLASQRERGKLNASKWAWHHAGAGMGLVTRQKGRYPSVRLQHWRLADEEPFLRLVSEREIIATHVVVPPTQDRILTATKPQDAGVVADVEVCDLDSGRLLTQFRVHGEDGSVAELAPSPDGRLLAVRIQSGDKCRWSHEILLWDVSGGTADRVGEYVSLPVFSPDGRQFVVAIDGGAELFASLDCTKQASLVRSGDRGPNLKNGNKVFPSIDWSPDGRLVAVVRLEVEYESSAFMDWISDRIYAIQQQRGSRIVRMWDAATGEEHAHLVDCQQIVFSPDSRTVAAFRSGGTIELWDLPIRTAFNSWWTITAAAIAVTVVCLAALLAIMKRLSRRTAKPAEAGPVAALQPEGGKQ